MGRKGGPHDDVSPGRLVGRVDLTRLVTPKSANQMLNSRLLSLIICHKREYRAIWSAGEKRHPAQLTVWKVP